MIQGTTSYSGKSLMVTGFCKIFRDRGYRVAPFKAQNMSLNSYVTIDGAEIARSQATQAFAAGIEPTAEMNPILLKPRGDSTSQIVLMGRPYGDYDAERYYEEFALTEGIKMVRQAFNRLVEIFDIVIIEGAGSPAEINLYERDIANMRIADLTRSPVILVADIDRGGVFASIVGTLQLLKSRHRRRIKGFIINKFRGDIKLLKPGIAELEEITKKKVLGVIPYLADLALPDEDSVALQEKRDRRNTDIVVGVIRLPRISNFTDFDPLLRAPGIELRYITKVEEIDSVDSVIIPGTKNTLGDLAWLKEKKLDRKIVEYADLNKPVLGICGGYQMLGKKIFDQEGVEGETGTVTDGLGLLDISTIFDVYEKTTSRVEMLLARGSPLLPDVSENKYKGYEIHMGKIRKGREARPIFKVVSDSGRKADRWEGASSKDGHILGTNIHGLFDNRPILDSFVNSLTGRRKSRKAVTYKETEEVWTQSLETLASTMLRHIDIDEIIRIVGLREKSL
ncbi:MAG: cobyric acid synthase [Candidatus Bathyarchaeota archaeon]|nr:MAG: cobyric acid synthase [Candidatus Bathyarchaeota archaeon]